MWTPPWKLCFIHQCIPSTENSAYHSMGQLMNEQGNKQMSVWMRDIHLISHYFQLQTMLKEICIYICAYVVGFLFLHGKFPMTMAEYPSLATCSPFLIHIFVAFENLSPSFYYDLCFSDDLWTRQLFNIFVDYLNLIICEWVMQIFSGC